MFVTRVSNRVANVVEARANGPAHVNDEPAFMRRLGVQKLDCATSRSHTVTSADVVTVINLQGDRKIKAARCRDWDICNVESLVTIKL